jgi:hypothetical protein
MNERNLAQKFTNCLSSPSASIFRPVNRPIWPIRIDSEMPVMNPVRIGRDRKLATMSRRNSRAIRQKTPTSNAIADAKTTLSPGAVSGAAATTAPSMIMVAASGPVISRGEGPKIAYPTTAKMLA